MSPVDRPAGDRAGPPFVAGYGSPDPPDADPPAAERWAAATQALLGPNGDAPWADPAAAAVPDEVLRRLRPGPSLVLGMGGSALGARAALEVAAVGGPVEHEIRILDTVDADRVAGALAWAEQVGAGLVVVSKSGSTIEVRALLDAALARGLTPTALVSDPGDSLLAQRLAAAGAEHVHVTMPPAVGGRFSVFTAVGQVPLHLAGLPARGLLDGAAAHLDAVRADPKGAPCTAEMVWRERNPAPGGAVVWCYAETLVPWAAWRQQLECESLGRLRGDGSRVGELVTVLRGPADQHSVAQLLLHGPQDKRITIADFADDAGADAVLPALARLRVAERNATRAALRLPTQELLVARRDLHCLGALMAHGMIVTVLAAELLGVSPYGQPAVEEIKRRIVWSDA